MEIAGYTILDELKNDNSGFSKWGFAVKNDTEYFIKEFLSPVYPINRDMLSQKQFEDRCRNCMEYERKRSQLYRLINSASKGNLVRMEAFFRYDSKYYIITEKINKTSISCRGLYRLPINIRYQTCCSILYAFACLHAASIVHFDVKPENILIDITPTNQYVAKIIDFDESFITCDPPSSEYEVMGDLTYLAPETFKLMMGENVILSEKADVFSLGLVLHECLTGKLPMFDYEEYQYPFEAVLDGSGLVIDSNMFPQVSDLIAKMLTSNPSTRISSYDAYVELCNIMAAVINQNDTQSQYSANSVQNYESQQTKIKYYKMAGDL